MLNETLKNILTDTDDYKEYKQKLEQIYSTKVEQKEWAKIKKENISQGYEYYVNKYPNGIYVEEAKKLYYETLESETWKKIKKRNTSKAYKEYIKKYPNGVYVKEAQKAYETCLDNEAWESAKEKNTQKAYEDYLKEFENALHKQEANEKIENFKADEKAWKKICKYSNSDYFYKYLKQYPNGIYSTEARNNIEDFNCLKQEVLSEISIKNVINIPPKVFILKPNEINDYKKAWEKSNNIVMLLVISIYLSPILMDLTTRSLYNNTVILFSIVLLLFKNSKTITYIYQDRKLTKMINMILLISLFMVVVGSFTKNIHPYIDTTFFILKSFAIIAIIWVYKTVINQRKNYFKISISERMVDFYLENVDDYVKGKLKNEHFDEVCHLVNASKKIFTQVSWRCEVYLIFSGIVVVALLGGMVLISIFSMYDLFMSEVMLDRVIDPFILYSIAVFVFLENFFTYYYFRFILNVSKILSKNEEILNKIGIDCNTLKNE